MRRSHKFSRIGRPLLLVGFLLGMFMIWSAPVMATDTINPTGDCEQAMQVAENGQAMQVAENGQAMQVAESGQTMQVADKPKPKIHPGGCPTPDPWPTGSVPPPGAIQINPIAPLPTDGSAICEAAANNACSNPGVRCLVGTSNICRDTWDFASHTCMCQCRNPLDGQ